MLLGGTRILEGARGRGERAEHPRLPGHGHDRTTRTCAARPPPASSSPRWRVSAAARWPRRIAYQYLGVTDWRFFLNARHLRHLVPDLPLRRSARPTEPADPTDAPEYGWRRYVRPAAQSSHIWLLAPTWIAVNAAIGVYSGQGLFNLVREQESAVR